MPEIPPAAIMAAATAIERELLSGKDYSMAQDSDEALARVALEAAAPILAEAWNLPALQAEHEEWQRRGEKGRRIHDEFYAKIDARHTQAADSPEVPGGQ